MNFAVTNELKAERLSSLCWCLLTCSFKDTKHAKAHGRATAGLKLKLDKSKFLFVLCRFNP